MTRTCLALQHLSFEDLGSLAPVLLSMGFDIVYRHAGVDDLSSEHAQAEWREADLVVVLGGPIGVYEAGRYPFIPDELARITERLESGKPLIGICLGAQLMAAANGQKVYPGPAKEIGYKPLKLTTAGHDSPLQALLDCGYEVLHWHGDTFDLPEGAKLLASTDLVTNQAFSMGPRVLGLQCHLEVVPDNMERWLIGHTAELTAAGIDVHQLRSDNLRVGEALLHCAQRTWLNWLKMAFAH
ncbi:MAG: glutamine amidotransferase [Burkholderiales bacterium]|nr:MAG: glutamine amidotransferase [Burkholderiales bacterium]